MSTKATTVTIIIIVVIIAFVGWAFYNSTQAPAMVADTSTSTTALEQTPTGTPSTVNSTSTATAPANPTAPATSSSTTGSSNGGGTTAPTKSAYFSEATNATLGTYLTDENGQTLYTYSKDTENTSNCYGGCATAWHPYVIPGVTAGGQYSLPMLPAGVNVTSRTDGTVQFTWNGAPLYYYAKDTAPGQTKGQGVNQTWYVVKLSQ